MRPLHDLWKLARGGSPVLCKERRLLIWLTSCSRTSCWSLVSTWHTSSRKNTVETADAFTGMAEVESAYVRCSFLLLVEVRAARARNLWITLLCDEEIEAIYICRAAGDRRVHEGWSLGLHQSQPSAVTAQHLRSWRFFIDESKRGTSTPSPQQKIHEFENKKRQVVISGFFFWFLGKKKKHEEGPTEDRNGVRQKWEGSRWANTEKKVNPIPISSPQKWKCSYRGRLFLQSLRGCVWRLAAAFLARRRSVRWGTCQTRPGCSTWEEHRVFPTVRKSYSFPTSY